MVLIVLLSFSLNHVNLTFSKSAKSDSACRGISLHSWLSLCDKLGRETKTASISDRLLTLSKLLS